MSGGWDVGVAVTGLIGARGTTYDGALKLTSGQISREGGFTIRLTPGATYYVAGAAYRPTVGTTAMHFGLETQDDTFGATATALYSIPPPPAGFDADFLGTITVGATAAWGRPYASTTGGDTQFAELIITPYGALAQLDQVEHRHIAPNTMPVNMVELEIDYSGHIATVTADSIPVRDGAGNLVLLTGFNQTCDIRTFGVGGYDTFGGSPPSTWSYLHAIWDGANQRLLGSASATAPTLPGGYTHAQRVGAYRPDGTISFVPAVKQSGQDASFVNGGTGLTRIFNGTTGNIATPVYTAIAINYAPPTAKAVKFLMSNASAGVMIIAPDNNCGAFNSATNPPYAAISTNDTLPVELPILGANFYYASNGIQTYLFAAGWRDKIPA